jgi:hypothetical protein
MGRVLELTEDQLDARIAAASRAGAEAAIAAMQAAAAATAAAAEASKPIDPNVNPSGYAQALRAAMTIAHPSEPEPVWCKSDFTGARFRAYVNHRGIVSDLLDYTKPDGWDKTQNNGGLLPNGSDIYANGVSLPYSQTFSQYIYETYWLTDARRFVGRPLPKHVVEHTEPNQS